MKRKNKKRYGTKCPKCSSNSYFKIGNKWSCNQCGYKSVQEEINKEYEIKSNGGKNGK